MRKIRVAKRVVALGVAITLAGSLTFMGEAVTNKTAVSADTLPAKNMGSGSIGIGSNDSQVAKLPTLANQGTYRFTTSHYDQSHPALDTTDWATNWLWATGGDRTNHNL